MPRRTAGRSGQRLDHGADRRLPPLRPGLVREREASGQRLIRFDGVVEVVRAQLRPRLLVQLLGALPLQGPLAAPFTTGECEQHGDEREKQTQQEHGIHALQRRGVGREAQGAQNARRVDLVNLVNWLIEARSWIERLAQPTSINRQSVKFFQEGNAQGIRREGVAGN